MTLKDVKPNMNKTVLFDKNEYCLKSCVLWLDEHDMKFNYSLVLLDKNQNSTIRVPIEKVGVMENGSQN